MLFRSNWKMNKTVAETVAFVKELRGLVTGIDQAAVVVAPPFTAYFSSRLL